MGSARVGASNNNDTQTCLTSIGIAEKVSGGGNSSRDGGIVNVELKYNTEIPAYNSSTCKNLRDPIDVNLDAVVEAVAAFLIIVLILAICCCGCCVLAIWFFCCRRTGSKGSLNENNQRPSTPEKAAPVQTTTVIQQPAMMAPAMM